MVQGRAAFMHVPLLVPRRVAEPDMELLMGGNARLGRVVFCSSFLGALLAVVWVSLPTH